MDKRSRTLRAFFSTFTLLSLVLTATQVEAGEKPRRSENPKIPVADKDTDQERREHAIALRRMAEDLKNIPVAVMDTEQERRKRAAALHRMMLEEQRYKGLSVKPHPDAVGKTLELQQRIAKLLARLDFVPVFRSNHFRWLKDGPIPTVHTGWIGHIEQTKRVEGGFLVKMKVYPTHTGGFSVLNDYVTEYYYYSKGRLRYLKSEADPGPKPISFN